MSLKSTLSGTKPTAIQSALDAAISVGKSAIHAVFPDDFEYYIPGWDWDFSIPGFNFGF